MLMSVDEIRRVAERIDKAGKLRIEFGVNVARLDASSPERRRQRAERRQPSFRHQAGSDRQGRLVGQCEVQSDRNLADEGADVRRCLLPFRKSGHAASAGETSPLQQVEDGVRYPGRQSVVVGDQADLPCHGSLPSLALLTTSRTM